MDFINEVRKAWVVVSLTVRYLLTTRRVIGMALLSAMPLILTTSLALARVPPFDIVFFQAIMAPLFLQIVLIFVTLVNATSLIREEIEDNTFPYLLTRPIAKPAIVAYKYIGYLAAVLVLLLPSIFLAYAVTEAYEGVPWETDSDVLAGFLAATILASATYGALFLFLSVVLQKPLAVGLLIGFLWESIVGSIPGNVPKLSVIYYLRSILKGMIDVGPFTFYPTDVSAAGAAAVLIGLTAAFLAGAMFAIQQAEFRQRA